MTPKRSMLTPLYWAATTALLIGALLMVALYAPVEASMGEIQKIFYVHLPAAINMFLAATLVFVASVAYIWTRKCVWDDLARAAARACVILCSIVLLTGMIWGKHAWGQWWTWSPRLTFSLVMWLLYAVYLVLRPSIESPQRRALVSAVYGVIAFLDVPLVYLSVKLLRDIHPSSVELAPAMRQTLLFCFVPVTMLSAGSIAAGVAAARRTGLSKSSYDLAAGTPPLETRP